MAVGKLPTVNKLNKENSGPMKKQRRKPGKQTKLPPRNGDGSFS